MAICDSKGNNKIPIEGRLLAVRGSGGAARSVVKRGLREVRDLDENRLFVDGFGFGSIENEKCGFRFGREEASVDGVKVDLAVGIKKTLRGAVVDVGDQVMGFAVAKVPLKREF